MSKMTEVTPSTATTYLESNDVVKAKVLAVRKNGVDKFGRTRIKITIVPPAGCHDTIKVTMNSGVLSYFKENFSSPAEMIQADSVEFKPRTNRQTEIDSEGKEIFTYIPVVTTDRPGSPSARSLELNLETEMTESWDSLFVEDNIDDAISVMTAGEDARRQVRLAEAAEAAVTADADALTEME